MSAKLELSQIMSHGGQSRCYWAGRVKVRIWTMTKNADIEKLVDMIFAMVKEFAQISKRANYTREKRKDR